MAVLNEVALPITVSTPSVDALFEADATVGVRLTSITNKIATSKTYLTAESVTQIHDGERSLWEITGFVDGTEQETLTPSDAAEFTAYGPTSIGGDDFYTFQWTGIEASNGARMWCRISVGIRRTTADKIEWYGWVGRENQINFLLRDFFYPRVSMLGPSNQAGGDISNYDAQGRTRIIVPMNVPNSFPYFFCNQPINAFPETLRVEHEGPKFMQMPFVTVCSLLTSKPADYLKNFAMRIERSRPFVWRFLSRTTTQNSGKDLYLELGFSTTASAIKDMGNHTHESDGLPAASYNANTIAPKHPHLIEVFKSTNEEFWWDICIRHREHYRTATGLVNLRANAALANYAKTMSHTMAVWTIEQTDKLQAVAMQNYSDFVELVAAMFSGNPYFDVTDMLCHQQVHQRNMTAGVIGEDLRDQPELWRHNIEFMQGNEAAWKIIRAIGARTSVYMNPWPWPYSPVVFRDPMKDRIRPFIGLAGQVSSPAALLNGDAIDTRYYDVWIYEAAIQLFGHGRLSGLVHDLFSGSTGLYFQPQQLTDRDHVGGGGAWYPETKKRNLDQLRARANPYSLKASGGSDPDMPLLSEIAEEFMTNVDGVGPSYAWQPAHFMGGTLEATMALDSDGNPFWNAMAIKSDYPARARQMQPFLWRIVHHEWSHNFNFSVNLSTQVLATEQAPDPGLSTRQWSAAICLHRALVAITGTQDFLHTIYLDDATYFPMMTKDLLTRDPAILPQVDADDVLNFCNSLINLGAPAYRQWTIDGIYERDIEIDYSGGGLTTDNNAAAAYRGLVDWATGGKVQPEGNWPFYSEITQNWRFGNKDFQVLEILHSVWRERATGRVGVIFINWNYRAADWLGQFDGILYGLSGPVTVSTIDPDGTKTPIYAGASSAFSITSAAAPPGGGVYLGHLAARSVTVIEVEN